ncbi:hypothetical protein THUN1379_24520 [Paludibacterium sp. THUN1379]|uniref:helix-turn-helix transcriptional regulator n=1 Tax=Paludibacterium sp. THUN1379 TaxID=3112107 RepID=UPI003089F708|nr:hypothetical protein THUN1379_24520 [Paludibacterium sp. THUN1379]
MKPSRTIHTGLPPRTGFLRLYQLIGCPRRGIPALLPFSRTTLWRMICKGQFPAPVSLGLRRSTWQAEQVWAWLDKRHQQRAAQS